MNNTKLTKKILFPLVKGSNWGSTVVNNRLMSAFVGFIFRPNYLIKVESFNSYYNFPLGNLVLKKIGYKLYGAEFDAVMKANKYLSKQYKRMAKYLEEEEVEKYTALFELLKNRSDYFLLVFWVRKTKNYKHEVDINKVWFILREIRHKLRTDSTALKFKRVFLKEFNVDGTLKKLRPLGVPEVQWRVIAGMYEFYLVNLLHEEWEENQYACMPRRGVVDAWIKILSFADKSNNIVGIDLAKFFDSVFINGTLDASKAPKRIKKFMDEIHNCKPSIRPQDRVHENERIANLRLEAPVIYYPPAEDLMSWVGEGNWNDRDKSLPQGLNTSPLIACYILGGTGAISDRPELDIKIVQYVDDGIIAGGPSPEVLTRHYKQQLNTPATGMSISDKKTEIIKENGKWIKPLKFLGCEYDGQTFKANTRKSGVVIIKDAASRISEIIKWLEDHRGDIISYGREPTNPFEELIQRAQMKKNLSRMIAEGWIKEETVMGFPQLDELKGMTDDPKLLWDKYRIKLTDISRNSAEWKVIEKYYGTGVPFINSLNTMSMLCAGTLLNSSFKAIKPKKVIRKGIRPVGNVSILYIAGITVGLWFVVQLIILWIRSLMGE